MTLVDVLTELATRGALPVSRVPAMKTSLKYLSAALGSGSPDACHADAALSQEAMWAKALETHFATLETKGRTISAYTRRNVRNDIRKVFKLAETHRLLKTPLPLRLFPKLQRSAFERQQRDTSPYRATHYNQTARHHYHLPQAQWPPDIQAGWRTYQAKCGLRLRETTLRIYASYMTRYLGYFINVCGRAVVWDDLFDVGNLTEFVRWNAARLGRPISVQGQHMVRMIAAMATVLKHPARRAIADLSKTLPMPAPLHTKRAHWVSLRELEAVAEACLSEGRIPVVRHLAHVRHHGLQRATQFQRGLMLKLLVRVPLRQRNLRELRLEDHLYQDQMEHWWLYLSGADLKIGERQGRINEYKINLTENFSDFIPALEEFLREYRPRLPGSATSKLCFLTRGGRPYTDQALRQELTYVVARHTGQRFYPHLIRTIWATEYLTSTDAPDWTTAAVMLGDKVATVMARYHDLVDQAHHPKAKAFLDRALQG